MPHPATPPNPQASAIEWRTESTQKAPQAIVSVQECSADAVLKRAYANTVTLWQGDFHNAKQVLAAIKKRLRKPAAKTANQSKHPAEIFHTHRMQQAQQARLINMLAVEVQPGFTLKKKWFYSKPIYSRPAKPI